VAAWITGWIYATQGDWAAGIARCQQGLESSPDPLNTAGALGYLGTAHLEQGNVTQAIPLLEQSIQQWQKFHFPQLQGWFTALLGEAHLIKGDIEHGQTLACQGLAITREVQFSYGVGVAQRILGKALQARSLYAEAETYLKDALQTFTAMSARFEVGRTHLALAELAHQQGDQSATTLHLTSAYEIFQCLQMPRYVDRQRTCRRPGGVPARKGPGQLSTILKYFLDRLWQAWQKFAHETPGSPGKQARTILSVR
jgi:tetratricopeptide (TPR) repeat protein